MRAIPRYTVLIVLVSIVMLAGCGRYKEDLEQAKTRVSELTNRVKALNSETARLTDTKTALERRLEQLEKQTEMLKTELEAVSKQKEELAGRTADLKEVNESLSAAKRQLTAKNKELADTVAKLGEEVSDLKLKISALKASAEQKGASEAKEKQSSKEQADASVKAPDKDESQKSVDTKTETSTPGKRSEEIKEEVCRSAVEFMKSARAVVRNNSGEERKQRLDELAKDFREKHPDVPEKLEKAVTKYAKEFAEVWEKSDSDRLFETLKLRNDVLDACGMTPSEAGF